MAVVAAAPYLAESVVHQREVARFERLRLAGNGHARNSPTIGSKLVQEGCFDLAERTRRIGPDGLSRAIDIYDWGCMTREPSSCAALAGLYERGEGVRRNLTKAHDLYAEACVLYHHAVSCVEMARMVYEGRGVDPDRDRALIMWRDWCSREPPLCTQLGLAYEKGGGGGGERNPAQAVMLLDLACRGGHAEGCSHLARLKRNVP